MMKNTAGWDEVLGREVMVTSHEAGPVRICGIIDDMHTGGFAVAEADFGGRPMGIFYCDSEKYAGMFHYIFVKYHKMSPEMLQKTDEIIGKILDGQWYRIYPCNELAASNFVDTLNTRNSILAGGIVTLFIALSGLIGYTIDEVRRRSKEIAVRRVMVPSSPRSGQCSCAMSWQWLCRPWQSEQCSPTLSQGVGNRISAFRRDSLGGFS